MINVARACRRPHLCVRCVSSAAVPRGAQRRPFPDDQSMVVLRLQSKSVAPLLACSQPRKTAAARAAPGPDAGAGGLAASLADLRASITQAAADQQHAQAAAAEAARLSEAAELAHAEAAAASRKARASAHKASLAAQTAAAAVAETPSASGGAAAVRPMPGVPASAPPAAISPAPASRPDAAQPASAGTQGVPPGPEVPKPDPAAAAGTASEAPAVAASDVDPTLDPTLVTRQDQIWMHRALQLARRGLGVTAPNPAVGCVIVSADGKRVVGEGYHPKAGEPHAEVFALRAAGQAAAGATAYVTLEPCNHFGRTPPCALALIAADVARVVVGVQDPNPLVGGRGLQTLRDAGIPVAVPCEEEFCWEINQKFMERMAAAT